MKKSRRNIRPCWREKKNETSWGTRNNSCFHPNFVGFWVFSWQVKITAYPSFILELKQRACSLLTSPSWRERTSSSPVDPTSSNALAMTYLTWSPPLMTHVLQDASSRNLSGQLVTITFHIAPALYFPFKVVCLIVSISQNFPIYDNFWHADAYSDTKALFLFNKQKSEMCAGRRIYILLI